MCAVTASCSQPHPHNDHTAPDDFALSVTVLGAPAATPDSSPAPVWLILSQDNSLWAQWGNRTRRSTIPPAVRVLSRPDVERVYQLTRATGVLGTPAGGHRIAAASDALPEVVTPAPTHRAVVVEYSAGGARRAFLFLPDEAASAPWDAACALAYSLGTLARQEPPTSAGGR